MKKICSRFLCVALALCLLLTSALCFAGCDKDSDTDNDRNDRNEINNKTDDSEETDQTTGKTFTMSDVRKEIDSYKTTDFVESDSTTEYVRITVKDHGDIVLRLRSDVAPETVKNFQALVSEGLYNGLTFHRVIPNFMIQGGDPNGNGTGSTTTIKGEMTNNGFENNLSHIRGVLSMARRGDSYDSGSCQFFICNAASTYLDKEYASFGYVVAGMSTVDSISAVTTNSNNKPMTDVVMEKVCFVKLK